MDDHTTPQAAGNGGPTGDTTDDLDRRLAALSSLPVPPRPDESTLLATAVTPLRPAPSPRRPFLIAAALVAVLLIAGTVVARRGADGPGVETITPPVGTGAWRSIASSPLSPRFGETTVWTGDRMLVFGGYELGDLDCFGDPACVRPPEHRDGAAYDPVADSWSSIAELPADFVGAKALTVGDRVIVIGSTGGSPPPVRSWTPSSSFPTSSEEPGTPRLLVYEPATDTWSEGAAPPLIPADNTRGIDRSEDTTSVTRRTGYDAAAVIGRRIFVAAPTVEANPNGIPDNTPADPIDWVYDVDADQWTAIPPSSSAITTDDRRFLVIDGRPLLFSTASDPSEPADQATKVALLDLDRGTWTTPTPVDGLPGTNRWYGTGRFAASPGGSAPWFAPTTEATVPSHGGWFFELQPGTLEGMVSPIPAPRQEPGGAHLPEVLDAGDWVIPGGPMVLHPASKSWVQVPDLPLAGQRPASGVWTGTELIVWGGVVGVGDVAEPTAAGAIWTPPGSGPALDDRATGDDGEPVPVETTTPIGSVPPGSSPPTVPPGTSEDWEETLASFGIDLAAAPPAVRDLVDAETCGGVRTDGNDGTEAVQQERNQRIACLLDAYLAWQPAALVTVATSVEGDPVATVYRTDATGTLHMFQDATRDRFGSGTWRRQECRWLSASPTGTDGSVVLALEPDVCSNPTPDGLDPREWTAPDFGTREVLPPWARASGELVRCGLVDTNQGATEAQRQCFAEAIFDDVARELATITHDDTGVTTVRWYRIGDTGLIEVVGRSYPNADDRDRPWVHQRCSGIQVSDDPGMEPVVTSGCEFITER